jgi:argininosuccinate synthase
MGKVALAYSGGLDTSIAVTLLKEEKGLDVVAVNIDLGEEKDRESIRKKALNLGAVASIVVDAREEFARDFIFPALQANALYEGRYPVSTSLARPLIAKTVGEVAVREGAEYVAHGSTGKGNDQVRFDLAFNILFPQLKVLVPFRERKMTRAEAIRYAEKRRIPVPADADRPYSIDVNLWGRSIECGELEEPSQEPPEHVFEWTRSVQEAPEQPLYLEIEFQKGAPVALDGMKLSGAELIARLNALGGQHGVGRIDMVENRLVGFKSREVYECPAAAILLAAHRDLESLTLERDLSHEKQKTEVVYADLIYNGLWYSPLRYCLEGFIERSQEGVSGKVRMCLHKGSARPVGRQSELSLYEVDMATYEERDRFDPSASIGFIQIYGLPVRMAARKQGPKGTK